MASTRKKDKKVEVSFTNWVLGGSFLSLTSTESDSERRRSASKRVIVTEDDESVSIKSPQTLNVDKKEKKMPNEGEEGEDKGGRKDKSKDKEKDTSDEKKLENCDRCGKKIVPCSEGCKGRTCSENHKSKSKFESKGVGGKCGDEKSNVERDKQSGSAGERNCWTEEQDRKIKEMKGENKSWKNIALEIGASKKDVQNRYKELMKGGDGNEESKDESTSENGWGGEGGGDSGNLLDFGALFVDDAEEGVREQSEGENKNNHNGGNGGGKKQKNKTNKQSNNNGNNGGGQNSQGGSSSGFGNPFEDQPEQAPTSRLRPDGAWTQGDCEILEYFKSKYEENKWLHMQAGFYNWTGRMVTAQLIEQKFKDDGAS